jgi:hypothetical protein
MTTAKSDLIKGIFSQLKLSAWWTVFAAAQFGLELGKVVWKLHDEFYPFNLLLWGAMTVFSFLANRGAIVRLTYSVALAEVDATRMKTRKLLPTIFGVSCVSFCFGLCAGPAKRFGGLYLVAVIASGVLLLLIGFLMYR